MTSAADTNLPVLVPEKVLMARIKAGFKRISTVRDATGLNWRTIEAYENPDRAPEHPNVTVLQKLARAYKVRVADFYSEDPGLDHALSGVELDTISAEALA